MVHTLKLSLVFSFVVMTNEQIEQGVRNLLWIQIMNINADSGYTAVHAPAVLQTW
jgi:hypothetical protein